MQDLVGNESLEDMIIEMWTDKNYLLTKSWAIESFKRNAPLLYDVSVAFDRRCSGSLGSRVSRKQLQALVHLASGNELLRVNSSSSVPSTCALCIPAFIGKGKTKSFKLLKKVAKMMRDGVAKLDEQIFDANESLYEPEGEPNENLLTQLMQYQNQEALSKQNKKKFKPREFIHTPGTKEG